MSEETNVNEEVNEEKATAVEEAAEPKTAVPDLEAFKAAVAANEENADLDDEDEESKGSVNMFGFLVQAVIIVICAHGYMQYYTISSDAGNWLWSGTTLLLPIINLWWVCSGLIYYWEIHWALALIITGTCLFSLVPKAPGYICAVICIALFIICASSTFPERKSEAQMEQDLSYDMDRLSNFVISLPTSAGSNVGVKEGIEHMRDVRVRALRLGYSRFPKQVGQMLSGSKRY